MKLYKLTNANSTNRGLRYVEGRNEDPNAWDKDAKTGIHVCTGEWAYDWSAVRRGP